MLFRSGATLTSSINAYLEIQGVTGIYNTYSYTREMVDLDGSIIEEIPYIPFLLKDEKDVVILQIKYVVSTTDTKKGASPYLQKLVNILYSLRHSPNLFNTKEYVYISDDINIYNFAMDQETKMKLFIKGYT